MIGNEPIAKLKRHNSFERTKERNERPQTFTSNPFHDTKMD